MEALRLTRHETAPHSGSVMSRSSPPTRHNNACVPAVNGRLTRRDVFYSPTVERSSSRDRRHIVSSTTPSMADTAKGRLSRLDIHSMLNGNCSTEYNINNNAKTKESSDRRSDTAIYRSSANLSRDKKSMFQRLMKYIRKRQKTDADLDTSSRSGSSGSNGCSRRQRRKPRSGRSSRDSGVKSVSLDSSSLEASPTPPPDENEEPPPDHATIVQQYHELLKCIHENEVNINQNAMELESHDRKLESYMETAEADNDYISRETAEFYRVKRAHKNVKDEAARVRVEHKEQVISADILQGENEKLKEEIIIMCGKMNEVKERVALGLNEVIDDTAEMKLVIAAMRQKNELREQEADAKRDELNEIKMKLKQTGMQYASSKPVYSFDGSAPLPPQMSAGSPTPSSSTSNICNGTFHQIARTPSPVISDNDQQHAVKTVPVIKHKTSTCPLNEQYDTANEQDAINVQTSIIHSVERSVNTKSNTTTPNPTEEPTAAAAHQTKKSFAVFEIDMGDDNMTVNTENIMYKKRQAWLNKKNKMQDKDTTEESYQPTVSEKTNVTGLTARQMHSRQEWTKLSSPITELEHQTPSPSFPLSKRRQYPSAVLNPANKTIGKQRKSSIPKCRKWEPKSFKPILLNNTSRFQNAKSKISSRRTNEGDNMPKAYTAVETKWQRQNSRSASPMPELEHLTPSPSFSSPKRRQHPTTVLIPAKKTIAKQVRSSIPKCRKWEPKSFKPILLNNTSQFQNAKSKISTRRTNEGNTMPKSYTAVEPKWQKQNSRSAELPPTRKFQNVQSKISTRRPQNAPTISSTAPVRKYLPPVCESPLLSSRSITPYGKPLPPISARRNKCEENKDNYPNWKLHVPHQQAKDKFKNIKSKISTRRPQETTTKTSARSMTPYGKHIPPISARGSQCVENRTHHPNWKLHIPQPQTKDKFKNIQSKISTRRPKETATNGSVVAVRKYLPPISVSPLPSNRSLTPYGMPLPQISARGSKYAEHKEQHPNWKLHVPQSQTKGKFKNVQSKISTRRQPVVPTRAYEPTVRQRLPPVFTSPLPSNGSIVEHINPLPQIRKQSSETLIKSNDTKKPRRQIMVGDHVSECGRHTIAAYQSVTKDTTVLSPHPPFQSKEANTYSRKYTSRIPIRVGHPQNSPVFCVNITPHEIQPCFVSYSDTSVIDLK